MLRRCAPMAFRRTAVALGGHGHHEGHGSHGAASGDAVFDAEAIASKASKPLERSGFKYKGSEKGGDVGARNEAAFVAYEPHTPENFKEKYVMPDNLNLLTVTPLLVLISAVTALSWGVFLWDVYCRRHYSVIFVDRPAAITSA